MTSRGLLTALLSFMLLVPLSAVPGRVATGSPAHFSAADSGVVGGRGVTIRVEADAQRGDDWLTAGGGETPDSLLPSLPVSLQRGTCEAAPTRGINLPPCGLRAGPRQTTGPPFWS